MNDDEMVMFDADPESSEKCDPLPQTSEDQATASSDTGDVGEKANDVPPWKEDGTDLAQADTLSSDPRSDPDTDPSPSVEDPPEDRLEQLRDELNRLRQEIAAKDAFWERIGAECEEFHTLYPDASLSSLSDGVWDDVQRGIPIAAAFALAERRRSLTAQKAEKTNRENSLRSSGALSPTASDYFSPAEVRAMTQSEVRKNYQKIMQSMQKWH